MTLDRSLPREKGAKTVSIIIPLYNQIQMTKQCLDSLEETVKSVDYEVILIDDCSQDSTRDFIKTLGHPYRTVFNESNCGYAVSNNKAARLAKGEFLCLLNNDTILTPGWLEPMLSIFDQESRIGAVGNVQVDPQIDRIEHAGVFFDLGGNPGHVRKGSKDFPKSIYQEWNAVTGACLLIKTCVFFQLKGFDESYTNGSEDIDLCIRLRLAGFHNFVANTSRIYHYGSSSPGRYAYDDSNTRLFQERWGKIARTWGRHEWPTEYMRRYAKQWWRFNLRKFCLAIFLKLRNLAHRREYLMIDLERN
jgi:GT2 family glycosyltransferase